MTKYLICYDIRQPRRLQKVHNYLKKIGLPIQYSIFILDGDNKTKVNSLLYLHKLIDRRVDDLRCYVLSDNLFQCRIGCSALPSGIYLSSFPHKL